MRISSRVEGTCLNNLQSPMRFRNNQYEVEDVVRSYAMRFGVRMAPEDADRMLTLFNELCDIFQFYDEEDRGIEFFEPLLR